MTRLELTTPITASPRRRLRGVGAMSLAAVTVVALGLSSCGGGDDDDAADASSTTVAITVAPTTTRAAPTTTVAPATTTTIPLVTEGATLIVANASGINGAAGRMSDELAVVGFSTGEATNSSEGQLEVTKIYVDPENPDAEAVANSVRQVMGGGDIEVLEMGVPAPVESGETGDATIVVAMGNDTADKTLDELQGITTPAAEVQDDESDETDEGDESDESDEGDEGDEGDEETTETSVEDDA